MPLWQKMKVIIFIPSQITSYAWCIHFFCYRFSMRTIWNQALSLPYLHKLCMWVDALYGEAFRVRGYNKWPRSCDYGRSGGALHWSDKLYQADNFIQRSLSWQRWRRFGVHGTKHRLRSTVVLWMLHQRLFGWLEAINTTPTKPFNIKEQCNNSHKLEQYLQHLQNDQSASYCVVAGKHPFECPNAWALVFELQGRICYDLMHWS
jgi:hypothetical protein